MISLFPGYASSGADVSCLIEHVFNAISLTH